MPSDERELVVSRCSSCSIAETISARGASGVLLKVLLFRRLTRCRCCCFRMVEELGEKLKGKAEVVTCMVSATNGESCYTLHLTPYILISIYV